MTKQNRCTAAAAFFGILALILDSKTALAGARSGMEMVICTVIPSLFPFFFLSILLTGALRGTGLPILRPLARLLRMPCGSEFLLLPAFLGGYPAGAQAVYTAWKDGILEKEDAGHLLSFCNNAGPSFLFGMVSTLFPQLWMTWLLWLIHMAGAVLTAWCFPIPQKKILPHKKDPPISPAAALSAAMKVMGAVCGWVVLFRILTSFLNRWILWMLPTEGQALVIGLLELANGCFALKEVTDLSLRFVICSCLLSFGGLCVTMQTASAAPELSMKHYLFGKLLHTAFSFLFSMAVWYPQCRVFALLLPVFLFFKGKNQKSSSNQLIIGV